MLSISHSYSIEIAIPQIIDLKYSSIIVVLDNAGISVLKKWMLAFLLFWIPSATFNNIPQKVSTKVSIYDDIFFTKTGLLPLPENAIEIERIYVIQSKQLRTHFQMANDATGNIYTSDRANGVINKFNQKGDYSLRIGGKGKKKGKLLAPYHLLIESETLIAYDIEKKQLEYFDCSGTYLKSQKIPELIDITSNGKGLLYIAQPVVDKDSPLVNAYFPDGKRSAFGKPIYFTHSIRELNSRSLAVDENGNVFVAFTYFPILRKYTSHGKLLNEYRLDNPTMHAKENYNLKKIGEGVTQKSLRAGYRAIIIDIESIRDRIYLLSHVPRLEITELDSEGNVLATYWKNFQEVYETNDLLVQMSGQKVRFFIAHSFAPRYEIDVFEKRERRYQDGLEGEIERLTEEIETNPDYFTALNNRGIAKYRLGDFMGAINDLTKAIELNPESSLAYNNRGLSKAKIMDFEGAISDFSKAANSGRKRPPIPIHSGQ